MAVQIGYGNAISTECKPLKSNDLAREVHCSNIVIIRYISNSLPENTGDISQDFVGVNFAECTRI